MKPWDANPNLPNIYCKMLAAEDDVKHKCLQFSPSGKIFSICKTMQMY